MKGSAIGNRGLALLAVTVAFLVLEALIAAGFFLAAQQFRLAAGGWQASAAFYAAEAGLVAGMNRAALADPLRLAPGATRVLLEGRLRSGDRYVVRLTRLDSGQALRVGYYLMTSTGLAQGPWGGRRQVALLLVARPREASVPVPPLSPKLVLLHPLAEFFWLEILE